MTALDDTDVANMLKEPRMTVLPIFWIIASHWHQVVQYVTTQLGHIEWEIEVPTLRKGLGVDATMQKLHPWRRNVTLYRGMVAQAINCIFPQDVQWRAKQEDPDRGLAALYRDFQIVLEDIDRIQARIERIVSVATALQSIVESRRAIEQNNDVARLTYLATLFIPLTFVSGFLSMVPDVSELKRTFWIFFIIAIPLTVIALVAADFWHLRGKIGHILARRKKKAD